METEKVLSFRDLEIYQMSSDLAVRIYTKSLELPSQDKFEAGSPSFMPMLHPWKLYHRLNSCIRFMQMKIGKKLPPNWINSAPKYITL
jgi:hypothetical protein